MTMLLKRPASRPAKKLRPSRGKKSAQSTAPQGDVSADLESTEVGASATLTPTPTRSEPISRVIQVYANLLPDEVIAGRRLSRLKIRLFAALVLLALLLAAGYAYSWWQTSQAEDNLALEQQQSVAANQQLNRYTPLLQAQASAVALQAQVAGVMTSDLQWSELMAKIRGCAPAGLVVSQVSGAVNGTTPTAVDPLAPTGQIIVGQLNLTGTARNYRDVATFVDALARAKGLANINPGSISGAGTTYSYTMTLSLTSDALGGRFTPKAPASQGAASSTTTSTTGTR